MDDDDDGDGWELGLDNFVNIPKSIVMQVQLKEQQLRPPSTFF